MFHPYFQTMGVNVTLFYMCRIIWYIPSKQGLHFSHFCAVLHSDCTTPLLQTCSANWSIAELQCITVGNAAPPLDIWKRSPSKFWNTHWSSYITVLWLVINIPEYTITFPSSQYCHISQRDTGVSRGVMTYRLQAILKNDEDIWAIMRTWVGSSSHIVTHCW